MKVSIYPFVNSLQEILIRCMNFSAYVNKMFTLVVFVSVFLYPQQKKMFKIDCFETSKVLRYPPYMDIGQNSHKNSAVSRHISRIV